MAENVKSANYRIQATVSHKATERHPMKKSLFSINYNARGSRGTWKFYENNPVKNKNIFFHLLSRFNDV